MTAGLRNLPGAASELIRVRRRLRHLVAHGADEGFDGRVFEPLGSEGAPRELDPLAVGLDFERENRAFSFQQMRTTCPGEV